jgi:hypothetical protein
MPWSKGERVECGNPALEIVNTYEDVPEWGRRYVIKLDNRATLTVSAYTYLDRRSIEGELHQPNGKYVTFQPGIRAQTQNRVCSLSVSGTPCHDAESVS